MLVLATTMFSLTRAPMPENGYALNKDASFTSYCARLAGDMCASFTTFIENSVLPTRGDIFFAFTAKVELSQPPVGNEHSTPAVRSGGEVHHVFRGTRHFAVYERKSRDGEGHPNLNPTTLHIKKGGGGRVVEWDIIAEGENGQVYVYFKATLDDLYYLVMHKGVDSPNFSGVLDESDPNHIIRRITLPKSSDIEGSGEYKFASFYRVMRF
jgi:hypothetical protein